MMEDFNAMIGSDNRGYEEILGQQGLGKMKNKRERFVDLCAQATCLSNRISSSSKGYTG